MKRRVLSFIVTLALCLNLCPVWVLAADEEPGGGLCPHHPEHTEECGYVPSTLEQECTHTHEDGCYITETECIHEHTTECYPDSDDGSEVEEPVLCTHVCTEDSGCVTQTLSCPHEHDNTCGYAPEDPGVPCGFVCRICPIDDLIANLPRSVSAANSAQVQVQLREIYDLYDELTDDEQQQVDLSPCVSLQEQMDEMHTEVLSDSLQDDSASEQTLKLTSDKTYTSPYDVSIHKTIDTDKYTLYGAGSSAIQVTATGKLYLKGTVTAQKGVGVQVLSGGFLSVTDPNTTISGMTRGLDIAADTEIYLSAGTYVGKNGAIRTEDGDFARLLAPGCAYFDTSGNPILLADMAGATIVVVGSCADHLDKSYAHTPGETTHTWTCPACGTSKTEPCTFTFHDDGTGTCICGNSIKIYVDEDDLTNLVYDGTVKPEDITIQVTLTDGSNVELVKETDYTVTYVPRADAGEITVTVTGLTFHGTFTKTYTVSQDRPALDWDTAAKPVPVIVDYDGDPVEADDLPPVQINIQSATDDLREYLQYSYREQGESDYTDGLPTNAGTYDIVVSLPELPNFEAAVSTPITLIINKIPALITPPKPTLPTYDGSSHELVTAGEVEPGAVIEYARSETGPYSTDIPTGINAGDYTVWYRIPETENYTGIAETEVTGVEILRKQITPVVTLSDYTYLYDGGEKEPKVTVKDEDDVTVLLDTEYQVEYVNNRNVSTDGNPAKVVVTDKPGGNYAINQVEVEFKITLREQATLSITEKPDTVTYGDAFTLSTLGGSGNGNVTWEIVAGTANDGSAAVNPTSGLVRITGAGTITVKATKSGVDPETNIRNYDDATAIWTFEASKKSVVATVTAEDKAYDGSDAAKIHAVVEEGVLSGDEIIISGLDGTFSDANAGADKTVTVDFDHVSIRGTNYKHYDISYSSTTVKATIHKAIANITTPPVGAVLTYNGNPQVLINDASLVVDPNSVLVEYAMSKDGPYSTTLPVATNADTYTVWYRVQETGNYTGLDPVSVDVEIAKKPVSPTITLSGVGLDTDTTTTPATDFYIYDGTAKTPAVTLTEPDGTIPASEYTVAYRDNTNVGSATVTVTAKADGNYAFTPGPVTKNFAIRKEKAQVTTAPDMAGDPLTYTTRAQRLVTPGEGYGGTMVYSLDDSDMDGTGTYSADIPTKTDAGDYTVYYKVAGDGNHSDSDVGSVTVTIAPKTVKDPTIELFEADGTTPLVSYTYDGTAKEPKVLVKDGSTLIAANEYNIVYSNNTDAGDSATVNITDKPGGNYTVTGSAAFVIAKADIVFNPAPSAAVIVYDGKSHELLVPGTTSGGEVLYALNSATSTYAAAIPEAAEAGNYVVYYKVTGDKNHNDLAVQSVPVTIQRKPLTDITITLTPAGFDYDGTVKLPEVTVKDGKTVLPEEEYTWECDTSSPTAAGTYTITVTDAPGGNYDLTGVTNRTATFTIGQIPQEELVIGGKPSATNYGDSFQLTVSGGSGSGAVTWKATGPASVDTSGNVTITGVGEVTITVEKAADTNYIAAQTQWTFTAAPKPVTADIVAASRDYDGTTDATVTSAGIGSADLVDSSDVVTIDKTSITAAFDTPSVGTGKTVKLDTSKVQVTGDDADKYAIRYPDTVTADITQATTSINTQPQGISSLEYTGQPQALVTAGETNVGFIVYSLEQNGTYTTEIPTGTNAGMYTVYYKVDGTADYTAEPGGSITVTIDPKTITATVELSKSSYVYDGTKQEPTITVKDGGTVIDTDQYTVTWADDSDSTATSVLTNVGKYTATIKNVTGGNYTFTATAQVKIVAKGQDALNITGQPDHVYYGDTIRSLTTTGGSGNGTVTWSSDNTAIAAIDPDTGVLTIKDVGTVTVKAERAVPNYETVSAAWTFTVEPKPVVAEVTVTAKDYDGTNSVANTAITANVKAGDLVDPDNDTITITGLAGTYDNTNAGTNKTVTLDDSNVKITGDTGKYAVSCPATVKADINPRTVTVSVTLSGNDLQTDANGAYYEYDGTEKKPDVTVTADDNNAVLAPSDYTVSYANNKNAGNATVTVTNAEGGNYTFVDKTEPFAIKKAAAQLTGSPQAKDLTYDGTAQELVTVGTATGGHIEYTLDHTDPSSYSTAIPTATNADTYIVYYKVVGDTNHEGSTTPDQVSVTIKAKEITPKITLSPTSYVYDGNECQPTVTVEDGADTIPTSEYTVSYRDNINAGTAAAIVSDNNGGNYIVNGTAAFTIEKAAPTVTNPTGKTGLQYNGELQELVTAGVSSDGTVVYSVNGGNYSSTIPTASAVGQYTIEWKVLGDDNHSDTAPETLTPDVEIAKNTVTSPTISLSQDTFQYNGSQQKPAITVYDDNSREIPAHEYTVTITGGNGNNMVDVDTYTITVTTPSTSNYVIQSNNTRTFTIVPANQETISITGAQAQVRYGDVIQLGTTGGIGGGQVTWTVTDANGDPVNSTISTTGLLTVKDVGGPITVTATCSAGGNYKDVSATWEFSAAKKPVTAVVTVADKPYDGNTSVAPADITATVNASDLVTGDSILITGLSATFDNASAGTNKKVTINSSSASVSGTNSGNYDITYPATTTASILAQAATVDADPQAKNLTYDASQSQELVTPGTVTGGTMVYSLDGTNFTAAIPKAKDAGPYTVYFKAQGDGNHTDSLADSVTVTIARQAVTAPQIELTPPAAPYDGQVKRPKVTVYDSANNVIPASEYKVAYVTDNGENWKDQGTYTVKIENVTGGNYIVDTATENFTISTTAQNPLEITNKPGLVHYGDTFTLSAVGGSGNAAVTWSVDNTSVVKLNNGFVEIVGVGTATITATRPGGTNYDDATATYSLHALRKPITAIVTADDKVYDGITPAAATLRVTWKDGDLVGADSLDTTQITGAFTDNSVGTNKTVNISGTVVSDSTAAKYVITIPATTTASILKADAAAPNVTGVSGLTYTGSPQDLVSGGDGNTRYSDSRDGVYSSTVPTGTNAGTYTVWFKATGDSNHNDSQPQAVTVTISPKPLTVSDANATLSGSDLKPDVDGTYYYEYDGTEKTPSVIIKDGAATVPASEYTVSYSGNKNVGTATVTITDAAEGNYTVNGSVTFAIRKGDAQLTSAPQKIDLTYTGQAQELVTVGTASGGHIEYSLDGGTNWQTTIPTETGAGTYIVSYKVVGDDNHADGPSGSVTVTIKPKEIVSPKITVTGTYTYDGSPKVPAAADITVEDGTTTIPAGEYTVTFRDNVEAGTATVVITNANGGNYIVNGTATFEIAKAAASATAPNGLENLPYNGTAQVLVTAGASDDGTVVYSVNGGNYSAAIPTASAVGTYTIDWKVLGDDNHNDTEPASVTASIVVNNVTNPTIQVTPGTVTYNGEKQEPVVTVYDDNDLVIDGSEYTVTYADANGNSVTNLTSVGEYTLTITGGSGGNYTFDTTNGKNTATFTILAADQPLLAITGTRERVYYGDEFQLSTTGGSGAISWDAGGSSIANIDTNGQLTITGVGSVTVTATSTAPGYTPQKAAWTFIAERKPVTAVVTAEARTYKDGDKTATVTATLQSSDLVGNDVIKITLSGSFEDPNAGTDKKVKVDSSNPSFTGSTGSPGNYNITYPATTTASILKADIDTTDTTKVTAPTAKTGLEYTGNPQTLVTAGSSTEGFMEYSTDNITYSTSLPTGTNAGNYDVWYRVKGDSNHNDTAGTKLGTVTIAKQTVTTPKIEFTPSGASYDGQEHKPVVKVIDKNGRTIPAEEYTVDYGSTNWRDARDHEVKVTAKGDGNYVFDETPATFTILPAGQSPLTILGKPTSVKYGDVFVLSTLGGSGNGAVTWETDDTSGSIISLNEQTGKVEVLKAGGPVTITARKQAEGGYSETTAAWTFSAEKKPVTAIVTAKNKEYDTKDTAALVVTWPANSLLNGDNINLASVLKGTFDDRNVGTDKTVTISGTAPASDKYDISWNTTAIASITPKTATVTGVLAKTDLEYTGQPQALVTEGTATGGNAAYSLDGISYTLNVPQETNAGTYTVWYKALADDRNYVDGPAAKVTVTISQKTLTLSPSDITLSGSGLKQEADGTYYYEYDGTAKRPDVVVKDGSTVIPASEYNVSYNGNIAAGTATVTITNAGGGNYNVSGSTTFQIKAAAAALKDPPQANSLTYNGSAQALVSAGTAVNGRVVYSETETGAYTTSIPRKTDAGTYQVWYKVEGNDGTAVTTAQSISVTIQPKTLTNPTIVLEYSSVVYDGNPKTPGVYVLADGLVFTDADCSVRYVNNDKVGTAMVIVQSSGGNYKFSGYTTFEITGAKAVFDKEPEAVTGLVYNGTQQDLVTPGSSSQGMVQYSLNGVAYSTTIPAGTEVGTYTILAKVVGYGDYADSSEIVINAEIKTNSTPPTVELSDTKFTYTGSVQKPTVTLRDSDSRVVIPATEYTVTYDGDTINPGKYKLKITSKGNNYSFDAIEREIEIVNTSQPLLEITGKQDKVCYGDTLRLGVTGGSGTGSVTWTVTKGTDVADIDQNGVVTIKKAGSVTITATSASSGGYEAATAAYEFYVDPKPVKATVIAASRQYDGSTAVALTVTISGLVSGDTVGSVTAIGQFTDGNVGTNKTVIIDRLNIPDAVSEKYAIDYNHTTTASITPKAATVTGVTANSGLTYNGSEQALLDSSSASVEGGNLAYSLDGGVSYSFNIPTGTDAKSYTVWYKVSAGDNYKDSAPASVTVTIGQNTDKPTVLCVPDQIQYDGTAKTPTVVVRDSANRIILESEYSVSVDKTAIAVGEYTVTVTDKQGGNYDFMNVSTPVTGTFHIVPASQNPLTITGSPADVYYGDRFVLSAVGGSGTGAIQWSIDPADSSVATIAPYGDGNAIVTVTGTGGFTVKAYREGKDGYSQSNTASVPFVAKPKPVTPVVTATDRAYDGSTDATLDAKISGLVGNDSIVLAVTGEFVTPDVGTNKQVKILKHEVTGVDADKYTITWPESTTASIYKVDADWAQEPADAGLTYIGTPQALVTAGTTKDDIGTVEYSTSQNGRYSTTIPTGTNAGKYTVWYRVAESVNYMGIDATQIEVEIAKATPKITTPPTAANGTAGQTLSEIGFSSGGAADVPGKFAWANDTITPVSGTSYDVIFTPDDTDNYNTVTVQITVNVQAASSDDDSSDSDSTSSASTTVQNGTANTVVSAAEGSRLVREAVANQSESIVIKPEVTSDVTKAEVSIPASTVGRISSETSAALTVSAPIADVTIPNAALDTLSSAGGTVRVITEQVDQAVVLTLTAGGEPVESVPGGVTLTVPAENAGPGTVAVLVHGDGTRETLRKSVVEDGKLSIPLEGSATVEIVDNSKEFTDVSSTNWAADAVAFASAHELFSGTSETTFGPDQAMSRGMLATVLYSLEGRPEQELTSTFSDVSSDAWYADSIAWATENGIVSGYGSGQFGPNDSITREQFAVMLWKYAGSPKASGQNLDFTDADQASGYALEALCWAAENGIMSGYSSGRLDPGGTTTRAQAAQMLKNFLEST